MKFSDSKTQREFESELRREVRDVVVDLDIWSMSEGFPELMVTDVMRSPARNEQLYWEQVLLLRKALRTQGLRERLKPAELELAQLSDADARSRCIVKFSYHFIGCAADVRTWHYSPAQLAAVRLAAGKGRARPGWEVLIHDVGHGPHLHIGLRDEAARKTFEDNRKARGVT